MDRDLSHHRDEEAVFRVGPGSKGWTLERYLHERIPKLPQEQLREAIRTRVRLSWGEPAQPQALVRVGGEVLVGFRPDEEGPPAPPIAVLMEDDAVLVVDKPSGVLVHPVSYRRHNTLTRILERERGYGLYMVHRLDRDTSGVFLLAKRREAAQRLTKDFELRRVEKEYFAWVEGELASSEGSIETPLAKVQFTSQGMRREIAAQGEAGEEARTEFRVEAKEKSRTLVRLFPHTGRTHQLRVHMASIGHPILGDKLYGHGDSAPRLMLHAARLGFEHPASGKRVRVEAPLPADWKITPEVKFGDG